MSQKTILPPNYTQVPNSILGDIAPGEIVDPGLMASLNGSDLKVLLAVCRITFGYHREERRASITMLEEMTGLSRQSVISAASNLADLHLIEKSMYRGVSVWRVVVQFLDHTSLKIRPEESKNLTSIVQKLDQDSLKIRPPSKKETINKPEKKNGGEGFTELKNLYESEFGSVTVNVGLILAADLQTWGLDSLREAIEIAITNDKRVWSYVRGILRRQAEAQQQTLPLIDELPEPEVKSDVELLWETAKSDLRLQMTQATFDAQIAGCQLRQDNGGYVVVATTTRNLEILLNRLRGPIVMTLTSITGKPDLIVDFMSQAQNEEEQCQK